MDPDPELSNRVIELSLAQCKAKEEELAAQRRVIELEAQLKTAEAKIKRLEEANNDLQDENRSLRNEFADLLRYAQVRDAKQTGIISSIWTSAKTLFGFVKPQYPMIPTPEKDALSPFRQLNFGMQTPRSN